MGNRFLKSVGSYTVNYTFDAQNRLATADGGMAPLPTMTFTWDQAGRLESSSDGATYRYDGRGRRVRKTDATGVTVFHYDVAGRVIAETRPDGTRLRDYIYLGNKLVAVAGCITGSPPNCTEREWYHTDALGSVVARTGASGAVTAQFDYQPWGERSYPPAAPLNAEGDRQYNGRVFDPGTGFHDYGARMYWPEVGRFVGPDPAAPNLKNPASFNRYSYVYNNPYKYTDPDGEVPFLVVTGGIGAVAGGAWGIYSSLRDQGHIDWGTVGKDALIGGGIGLGLGAGAGLALAGSATASVEAVGTAGAALLGAGGAGAAEAGKRIAPAVDSNRLNHIFGQARHNLEPLVERFGSRESAFGALEKATQALVDSQKLTTFTKGILVNVDGVGVTVRGTVIDGVAKIGTAFIQNGGQ